MTGAPWVSTGAVKVTTAEPAARVAATSVGASGTPAGVTAALAADGTELPIGFVATAVNV